MPEFKKIYCAYHEKQFITNFCIEPHCCMPLCPSCIGSHNEFHKQNGSKSTYNSMDNVLNHTFNSMVNLIKSFQNQQRRIENITGIISEMPLVLHQKLMIAKTMTINQIQLTFQKIEKQMLLKLCARQEVVVGPNMKYVQMELKTISQSLIALQKMTKALTGQRCLSTLIKFLQNEHDDFLTIRNQLNSTVNSFECIQPYVRIQQQIVDHIDPLLKNFITIDFSQPLIVQQQPLSKSSSDTFFFQQGMSNSQSPNQTKNLQQRSEQQIICQPLRQIQQNSYIMTTRKQKQHFKCDQQIQNLSRKIAEMRKNNKIMSATLQRRKT